MDQWQVWYDHKEGILMYCFIALMWSTVAQWSLGQPICSTQRIVQVEVKHLVRLGPGINLYGPDWTLLWHMSLIKTHILLPVFTSFPYANPFVTVHHIAAPHIKLILFSFELLYSLFPLRSSLLQIGFAPLVQGIWTWYIKNKRICSKSMPERRRQSKCFQEKGFDISSCCSAKMPKKKKVVSRDVTTSKISQYHNTSVTRQYLLRHLK